MLQVHVFDLTKAAEKEAANKFLAENRPAGDMNVQNGLLIAFVEDGKYHPKCEIAELADLLMNARAARHQQEVALNVLNHEVNRAGISKKDEQDLRNKILTIEEAISIQHVKEAFLAGKIEELQE